MVLSWARERASVLWLGLLLVGLAAGGLLTALHVAGADVAWVATTVAVLLPMAARIGVQMIRRSFGVDVVALLAMAGCLGLREYLAGAVVAVMFGSGQALEGYAQRRARQELTALMGHSPSQAHRYDGSAIVDVHVSEVAVGDRLMIRSGDVLPVDGRVEGHAAVLDESALTGEARPVAHADGAAVQSGTVNSGAPFTLVATSTAANSTYSGIVRLVEQAQASRAPLVRLADRYAAAFVVATLGLAVVAWIASGQLVRGLAVLVVATPCPLIIAAPVAIIAGVSRAARAGLIVKGGAVLERLGSVRVLLFDKTGTLTSGRPAVRSISALPGQTERDVLWNAASLDQMSSHPLATSLRRAAGERGIDLTTPEAVAEEHGAGIQGTVDGHLVRLGSADFVGLSADARKWETHLRRRAVLESLSTVFVSVDGGLLGAVLLGDEIRPDSARTVRALRGVGLERIVMVTGDHPDIAEAIGAAVGLDAVMAQRAPDEKAMVVEAERAAHGVVAVVGDGINDAPALAAADVGIAIGARGVSAASESADAVLVVDRLDNLADAVAVAQRSRTIALESITVGMGLSFVAMFAAALGLLIPVVGAVVQEGIDVIVILNALRALGGSHRKQPSPELSALSAQMRNVHQQLQPGIDGLRELADNVAELSPQAAVSRLQAAAEFLTHDVLPHEHLEEERFYPLVARHIGGSDPTATMLRAHVEIVHLSRVLARAVESLTEADLDATDILEVRRLLYALHSVLSLHNAQEDEAYISLVDSETHSTGKLTTTAPRG